MDHRAGARKVSQWVFRNFDGRIINLDVDLNEPYEELLKNIGSAFGIPVDKVRLVAGGVFFTPENYIEKFEKIDRYASLVHVVRRS